MLMSNGSTSAPVSKIASWLPLAAAMLAGAVAPLGWAPVGWWPLALAAYALLFGLLRRAGTVWRAALLGTCFGIGLHASGHGWIAEALHRHGGLGASSAVLSAGVVAIYLALFIAVPCGLLHALDRPRSAARQGGVSSRAAEAGLPRSPSPSSSILVSALAYASLLTFGEWARSLGFNGYTSLSLGYALVDSRFAGYLPVGGLYLASWAALLASAALALAWEALRAMRVRKARQGPAASGGSASRPLTVAAVSILPLLLAAGGWALQHIAWSEADGPPLSYRLIQSNIAQASKFDPVLLRRHVAQLVEQIEAAPADLIVTAETAFPMSFHALPVATVPRLQRFSRSSGSHVFIGVASTAANGNVHNSTVLFTPRSALARYDKARLMPFGEYSPAGFGWFTASLAIPLKDLSAGRATQPPFAVVVRGHTHRIGTLICHEDLIGRDGRQRALSSGLLINPSNLAWFDGSVAIAQRLQIARVRALEVGRPLLRATNTGITAHIDTDGRIVGHLPAGRDAVLSATVQPMRGATPYLRFGDALPLTVCLLGALPALGWWAARRRGEGQPSGETPNSQA